MLRKIGAVIAGAMLGLGVLVSAPALASAAEDPDPFAETCDDAELAEVELPAVCFDGEWMAGGGFEEPADDITGIIVLLVFIGLFGSGLAVWWRVSTARSLARKAGMDPDDAGTMAAFTDGGLEATYLASQLRTPAPQSSAAAPGPDVTTRLAELQRLRDAGTITTEEHDAQRQKIIDAL